MAQVITTAGEQLFAIKAQNNQPLDIDTFIFAYVPGQDSSAAIDRNEGLPPVGQRVHQQIVQQRGRVNSNVVIYSTVLDSVTGPFEFNWVGLYSSVNNTLVAISKIPTVVKTVTVPGTAGNILNRNFGIEYSGIADLDGITVDPETWQLDYTARLNGMDELTRQLAADMNGRDWFIDNGFKVAPLPAPNNFKVTAGAGYVSGLRIAIEEEPTLIAASYPQFVYVNAWFDGTSEATWKGQTTFQITPAEQEDYTDETGKRHYLFKMATITSADTVVDHRSGRATSPHPGIKYLLKVPGIKQTTLSFHTGLGVGGGDYIWLPNADQSHHLKRGPNGGVLWASAAMDLYDGTPATRDLMLNWIGSGFGCFELTSINKLTPQMYGVTGQSNDALAFKKWLSCEMPIFGSGQVRLDSGVLVEGKNVDLFDKDSSFVVIDNYQGERITHLVEIVAPPSAPVAISAITNYVVGTETIVFKNILSRIITEIPHDLVVGDIVKVLSQDRLPRVGSRPQRISEMCRVIAVESPTSILTDRKFEYKYVTRPMLVKLNKDLNFKGNFKFYSALTTPNIFNVLTVAGYVRPLINNSADKARGKLTYVKSCYQARGLIIPRNLYTDSANLVLGYGVVNVGSCFSLFDVEGAEDCRHGHTTGAEEHSEDWTDYLGYGGAVDCTVGKLIAKRCSSTPADTHPDSLRTTYVYIETDDSNGCFNSRGIGDKVLNIKHTGVGPICLATDKGDKVHVNVINSDLIGDPIIYGSSNEPKTISISEANIRVFTNKGYLITAPNLNTFNIEKLHVKFDSSFADYLGYGSTMVYITGGNVNIDVMTVEITGLDNLVAVAGALFRLDSDSVGSLKIGKLTLKMDATGLAVFNRLIRFGESSVIKRVVIEDLEIIPVSGADLSSFEFIDGAEATSDSFIGWRTKHDSSAYFSKLVYSTSTKLYLTRGFEAESTQDSGYSSASDRIYIECNKTSDPGTVDTFSKPYRNGQFLKIKNTSEHTLRIDAPTLVKNFAGVQSFDFVSKDGIWVDA